VIHVASCQLINHTPWPALYLDYRNFCPLGKSRQIDATIFNYIFI
jgi:hypothetical protein